MSVLRKLNDRPAYFNRTIGRDSADMPGNRNYVGSVVPAINIVESNDDFEIMVAAPGLTKECFKINLEYSQLKIACNREPMQEDENTRFVKQEFDYGSWERVFVLPDTVQTDVIHAHYENGILSLVLPKKEEAKQKPARMIEIK